MMDIIIEQLDDPMGAAVSLSNLLAQSDTLMRSYAKPKLVLRFLNLIRNLGPQPRFMQFFKALCAVDDKPVESNQDMVFILL